MNLRHPVAASIYWVAASFIRYSTFSIRHLSFVIGPCMLLARHGGIYRQAAEGEPDSD